MGINFCILFIVHRLYIFISSVNVNIFKKYMDILCETMNVMSMKSTLTSVKEHIS